MSGETRRGRFIVLEGIDGSGTTTQAARLSETLRARGTDVVLTCEPTPGPVGALIRKALGRRLTRAPGDEPAVLGPATLALLFAADRLDHLDSVVLPALDAGSTVISDRYVLSSLIYQSETAPEGPASLDWLRALNARAVRPDLTIVVDLDADSAAERRARRGGEAELFEELALQRKLAAAYARAETFVPTDRLVHVDGGGSPDDVAARILSAVDAPR